MEKTMKDRFMIALKGVSKRYAAVSAVTEADLTIPGGGIYGIIGKSGAGKSTRLRIMSLLEPPDRGAVYSGVWFNTPER
jgi:D-methionine transport system ATP-binding protein